MRDPYEVLGVPRNAGKDEVKKAYRELSRKYHPDSYVDNPLADLAEEKFREVQEAYETIMAGNAGGSYSQSGSYNQSSYSQGSSYSRSSSYGQSGAYQQNTYNQSEIYVDVRNLLNARRYYEALNALQTKNMQTAEWHYCYAVASYGMNNHADALMHASQAASMAPANTEYAAFLRHMQNQNGRYRQNPVYTGNRRNSSTCTGDACCDLWLADTCCECMGGDLCSCF